jgi:ABC-2 type transport system ATP-binding protein
MSLALQAVDIKHSYGNVEALAGLSFEVQAGEVFGLVGPDGAGKTTLLKIAVGLIAPTSGKLVVERGPGFGYIPQRFALYRDMTVEENIDFFGRVYGLRDFEKRKNELLEWVGLARFRARLADQLSGGMKQKLALCAALIHKPTMLVMDEPTTGVDPVSRREFWGVIFELQKQGLTVLASTPYMDEAEQFDRVALLDRGRFLRLGTTEEIKHSVPGSVYRMLCSNPYQARQRLQPLTSVNEVQLFGDSVHIFVDRQLEGQSDSLTANFKTVVEAGGIKVSEIAQVEHSIEDVFLQISQSSPEAVR